MMRKAAVLVVLAGTILLVSTCSEAPLIPREANRIVLAELFSTTG
jgi:hypothetical protein